MQGKSLQTFINICFVLQEVMPFNDIVDDGQDDDGQDDDGQDDDGQDDDGQDEEQ